MASDNDPLPLWERQPSDRTQPGQDQRVADRQLNLPGSTLALADEASTTAVRFDAELGGDVAPFGSILLRRVSGSSSRTKP
jgi:hypothetical protein